MPAKFFLSNETGGLRAKSPAQIPDWAGDAGGGLLGFFGDLRSARRRSRPRPISSSVVAEILAQRLTRQSLRFALLRAVE
jgi:hypothetical protein